MGEGFRILHAKCADTLLRGRSFEPYRFSTPIGSSATADSAQSCFESYTEAVHASSGEQNKNAFRRLLCSPGRIRTYDQSLNRRLRYHCATGECITVLKIICMIAKFKKK